MEIGKVTETEFDLTASDEIDADSISYLEYEKPVMTGTFEVTDMGYELLDKIFGKWIVVEIESNGRRIMHRFRRRDVTFGDGCFTGSEAKPALILPLSLGTTDETVSRWLDEPEDDACPYIIVSDDGSVIRVPTLFFLC